MDQEQRPRNISDIKRLWAIIIVSCAESFLHFVLDMTYLIVNPVSWGSLVGVHWIDALLWLIFRWLSLNLWVWVNLYAFNVKSISKEFEDSRILESNSAEHSFLNKSNSQLMRSELSDTNDEPKEVRRN